MPFTLGWFILFNLLILKINKIFVKIFYTPAPYRKQVATTTQAAVAEAVATFEVGLGCYYRADS